MLEFNSSSSKNIEEPKAEQRVELSLNPSWRYKPSNEEVVRQLVLGSGISSLTAQVCANRGISTSEDLKSYLNPRLDQLTHPFKIFDLERSARHIFETQQNRSARKKIRVFTDYDVDGTTGAALLSWFFRDMKFNYDVVQPDRFRDGYGLNVGAVEAAAADGVDTLITVDCGVTNFDAANRANELGIKLLIVDHHAIDPKRGVPIAFAVMDPHRSEDTSGLKQLCGCGLAFYLSMGIRLIAREAGYFNQDSGSADHETVTEPRLRDLLDLVVIATAADMVPLTGDNRILVKQGLDVLRSQPKPGLKALMISAGIEAATVSPMSLGFALGPRINASGRLGSAETAYRCLISKSDAEATALAEELETINRERQTVQNQIWDEVRSEAELKLEQKQFPHAVVIASSRWHEGVVGIVASRVTEYFKKPAIVMAIREDGIAKGSVRSYGGYSVLSALHECADLLKSFGGHAFAAGLSLESHHLEAFVLRFNEAISKLVPSKNKGIIELEGSCSLDELTVKALQEIETLGPFGPGNPEPVFSVDAWVESQTVLKGRHLKLKLCASHQVGAKSPTVEGIWFNAAERLDWLSRIEKNSPLKKRFGFAGIPELNRFRGRVTPTLRIKDLAD